MGGELGGGGAGGGPPPLPRRLPRPARPRPPRPPRYSTPSTRPSPCRPPPSSSSPASSPCPSTSATPPPPPVPSLPCHPVQLLGALVVIHLASAIPCNAPRPFWLSCPPCPPCSGPADTASPPPLLPPFVPCPMTTLSLDSFDCLLLMDSSSPLQT